MRSLALRNLRQLHILIYVCTARDNFCPFLCITWMPFLPLSQTPSFIPPSGVLLPPHKLPLTLCIRVVFPPAVDICLLFCHLTYPSPALSSASPCSHADFKSTVFRNPAPWDSNNRRTGDKNLKASSMWCPIRKPTKSDRHCPLWPISRKGLSI